MNDKDSPRIVGNDDWTWMGRWSSQRGGFPTFGVFLIVFGLLLVAGQYFTIAEYGIAAFFLAIGAVLIVSGIRDKSDLALFLGVFIAALALSDFLTAANVIHRTDNGWGTLFVGIGWILAALWRSQWGRRPGAGFFFGIVFALWGGLQVAQSQVDFPADKLVGPVLIIVLGVWIVSRRMRPGY
jgi:hypothetical protein